MAISGDTVVVGAYGEDGEGIDCGAAYVFERNQGGADNWGQVAKADRLRRARTMTTLATRWPSAGTPSSSGRYWEDGAGTDRGAAYVFERNQGGAR